MVELDGRQDAEKQGGLTVVMLIKRNKIIYWGSTGLLCAMMAATAIMYVVNYSEVSTTPCG